MTKAREEHRLRVLRRIFGPNMDEVAEEWRKLHNKELNCPYSSPNIVGVIKLRRWAGHVACIGGSVCRFLVGKPEGERPLGEPKCRWEDNIKMYLQEVECGGMEWIELTQDSDFAFHVYCVQLYLRRFHRRLSVLLFSYCSYLYKLQNIKRWGPWIQFCTDKIRISRTTEY